MTLHDYLFTLLLSMGARQRASRRNPLRAGARHSAGASISLLHSGKSAASAVCDCVPAPDFIVDAAPGRKARVCRLLVRAPGSGKIRAHQALGAAGAVSVRCHSPSGHRRMDRCAGRGAAGKAAFSRHALHWSRRDHRLLHRSPSCARASSISQVCNNGAAARQPLCCIFRKTRYNREYLRLEEFRHDCHCDRRALPDVRLAHPGPVRSRRARGCVRESVDRSPRRFCKPWRGAVRPSAGRGV